MLEKLNY